MIRGIGPIYASKLIDEISFAPDRARPAWLAIPVATGAPIGIRYHLRLRLPQDPGHQILVVLFQQAVINRQPLFAHRCQIRISIGAKDQVHFLGAAPPRPHRHPL